MRSRFAAEFNHDDCASTYDVEVRDESDPIRTGYAEVLQWVADTAEISLNHNVLDLGCGTGNTAALLNNFGALICVDVSFNMLELARQKLYNTGNIKYVQADLLEFFDNNDTPFDRIVSTYAIHHLTDDEKLVLFAEIEKCLPPGGRAVFGDLMFQNTKEKEKIIQTLLTKGHKEAVADIDEEFFWDIEKATKQLEGLGFMTKAKRFSELSWGMVAKK